jgi:anti-anti-sigma regulatory factor
MPLTLKRRRDDPWILTLSGDVGIGEAAALHAAALECARDAEKGVSVQLDACTSVDTSALQVLYALHRALLAASRLMNVEGSPPAIAETIRLAGFRPELNGAIENREESEC